MKKLYILIVLILTFFFSYSQTVLFYEDFEQPSGADGFVSSGNPGWTINNTLAYEGVQSYHTVTAIQDTSYAQTNMFNTTGNNFVLFSFAHIAKLSFFDAGILEISFNNSSWTKITSANSTYLGTGNFNAGTGDKFTAITYAEWLPANNGAIPDNSWWRVETFDLSNLAANQPQVWLRFKAYDGNNDGSAGNYGWLLDSVKVIGYVCDPALNPGVASATEDSICNLDPVNLSLAGYYGNIQWLYSTDGGASWQLATGPGSNSESYTVNPLQSTQYAAVTTLQSCVSDTSNIISIYVQEVVPPTTTGAIRCGIGNITLTATGNGILNWYTDTFSITPINTGAAFTTYITNTTTFYVGSFVLDCESPRAPVTATMGPADPVSISATSVALCQGESTTLTASSINSGYSYTWFPSTGLNTISGPTVIATPLTPTMYYATGDDGTCANFDSIFIDVGPAAIAGTASSPNDTVCTGKPMILSISGQQGNIQWYSSSDGISWTPETGTGSNSPNYEVTPLVNTHYMAVLTSAGCPADTTNVLFIVSDSPDTPVVTNATRCGYGSVTLQASGNGTLYWYEDSSSVLPVNIGTSHSPTLSSTTTYYVATVLGSNPIIFTENFENNGNNLPPGWTATGLWHITDACLTGTPPNPTRWAYYGQDGTCNFNNGLTNAGNLTTPVINIPASATDAELRFRYIYNGENGIPPFGYDNASVLISQNGGAFNQIYAITDFAIPTNVWTLATVDLSTYAGSNIQLRWNFNTVDGAFNDYLGLQVDSILIKGDAGCEGPRVPVTATVTPAPPIAVNASAAVICQGDTSVLSVTSSNVSYAYNWSPATGLNAITGNMVLASPTTTTTYTVVADDGTCGNIDSISIVVIPAPVAGIASAPNDTVCTGNSLNLTLSGQFGDIQWMSSTDGISWQNETGSGANAPNYEVTPLTDTYYMAVLSNAGCPDDTTNTLFITSLLPDAPVVTGTTRCGYGSVTVEASGNGTINWFATDTSTVSIGTGSLYTDTISATTTYYAENVMGGNTAPPEIIIGTGNIQNFDTEYPAPYGNYFWGARHQFLITAAELLNMGAVPNVDITSLAFDVVIPGAQANQNFEIKMGHTTLTDLSVFEGGLTSVYLSPSYWEVPGWNVHAFSTPFTWNGTDNIIVETCFNNTSFISNAVVRQSATTFTSTIYGVQDALGVCTNPGLFITPVQQRPNMKLEITGGGCASARVPVTATVTPPPPITLSASSTNLCLGDTSVLSVTSPNSSYSYTWEPNVNISSTTGASIEAFPVDSIQYYVIADDGTCGNIDSVLIGVLPPPVAGIANAPNDTVCTGNSMNLTLSGQFGDIQWMSSTDGISWQNETGPGANAPNYEVTPLTDTYYMAVLSNAGCPADTTNVLFITSLLPDAPLVTGATRCGYGSVNLQASGNGTLYWYEDSLSTLPINIGTSYSPILSSTTTYYVANWAGEVLIEDSLNVHPFVGGNGCGGGNMFEVNPIVNISVKELSIHLTAGTGTNVTVNLYYKSGTFIGFEADNTVWTLHSTVNVVSNGQNSPSLMVLPTALDLTGGQNYAFFVNADLRYTNMPTPTTYFNSDLVVVTGTGLCGAFTGLNQGRAWNGRIHYTKGGGCPSPRVPVTATVTPAPSITVNASATGICQGDTVFLTVSSPNSAYNYTWSPATGLNTTTGDSVFAIPSAPITYYVVADDGTCGNIDSVSINVGIPSTVNVTLVGGILVSSSPANNQWYFEGNPIPGATSQTYIPTQSGQYYVVVANNGCVQTSNTVIFTGIEEVQNINLSIYPNPGTGIFSIEFSCPESRDIALRVYNVVGELIYNEDVSKEQEFYRGAINISDNPNGLYFLMINCGESQYIQKLILAK